MRGGIVGIVDLVDCVTSDASPWFEGPVGWKLENARELPFIPCKGMLGIYECPDDIRKKVEKHL